MFPYYLILVVLILFSAIESFPGKKVKNEGILFIAFIIWLVFFIGFRGNSYDFNSYHQIYDAVRADIINKSWDLAFVLICKICPSFHFMLLFMGAITMIPLCYVVKKQSPYPFFSLLLFSSTFLYPTVMGQMRQGVTICLMLYAFYKWRDNKIRFMIIWLFCCTLHSSAALALLLILIPKRRYSIKIYLSIIVIALIISSLLRPIFAPFLQGLSALQGTGVMDRLEFYNAIETEQGLVIGLNSAMIIRIFTFLTAFCILKLKWQKDASVLNIYFLSIFIYLAFGFIPQIGGRGSQYFAVFDIILIPEILRHSKTIIRQFLAVTFILLSVLRFNQFFYDVFNARYYIPYKIEITE